MKKIVNSTLYASHDFSTKQQYSISKGITTSEIDKQAKGLQLESVEMTVCQANCVSSGVFDTHLKASLPAQTKISKIR